MRAVGSNFFGGDPGRSLNVALEATFQAKRSEEENSHGAGTSRRAVASGQRFRFNCPDW